jgi:hypothetical protein
MWHWQCSTACGEDVTLLRAKNEIVADFLEHCNTKGIRTLLAGRICSQKKAIEMLRLGQMFENGVKDQGGDEYWFSGTFEGKAFVLSIRGKGVGTKLEQRTYQQFQQPQFQQPQGEKK